MGTFKTENPGDQPVWVNTNNCKACDICVAVCPCIGCMECELSCPDFAIYVADRKELKAAGKSFAKLTDEAKKRQEAIVANNYMSLKQEGAK